MADRARLAVALKNADAAGDVAAARKFAQELRSAPEDQSFVKNQNILEYAAGAFSGLDDVGKGFVRSPLKLLSLPGDMLAPEGTTPFDEKLLGKPEDTPEARVLEAAGGYSADAMMLAAGGMIPLGKKLAATTAASRAAWGPIRRFFATGLINAAKTPVRTTLIEGAAGLGAGVAGQMAEENDAGPLVKFGAELAGGTVAGGAASLPTVKTYQFGKKAIQRGLFPFTEAGGKIRAQKRINTVVTNSDSALKNMDAASINPDYADLTAAQQANDPGLYRLEKTILGQDANAGEAQRIGMLNAENAGKATGDLLAMQDGEIAAALDVIRKQKGRFDARQTAAAGKGIERAALGRTAAQEAHETLSARMEREVMEALADADDAVLAIAPGGDPAAMSKIARVSLDEAEKNASDGVRQAWGAVDRTATASSEATRERLREITKETAKALQGEIPGIAKYLAGAGSKNRLPSQTTANEMIGLRTKLLEVARAAEAGQAPRNIEAGFARRLADAVLDDLATVGRGSNRVLPPELSNALTATRTYKEIYRQGAIGDILGKSRHGGTAVQPEVTLDVGLGGGGAKGAAGARQLLDADPSTADPMQQYMLHQFRQSAVSDGNVSQARGLKFLESNATLLDTMPDVRKGIEEAIGAASKAKLTVEEAKQAVGMSAKSAAKAAKEAAEEISRIEKRTGAKIDAFTGAKTYAGKFLGLNPDFLVDGLLRRDIKSPGRFARHMLARAKTDTTGQSVLGLKATAAQYMVRKMQEQSLDSAGEQVLSGKKLALVLQDTRAMKVLMQWLAPDDIARARSVAGRLMRIEASAQAKPLKEGVSTDMPSNILSLAARALGAHTGRRLNTGTIQVPGMIASNTQKTLGWLTKDKAEQILTRAFLDKDKTLLNELLQPMTPQQAEKWFNIRMTTWPLASARDHSPEE